MKDAKYAIGSRVRHRHTNAWGTVLSIQPLTLPDGEQWSWQYGVTWDTPQVEEQLLDHALRDPLWVAMPSYEDAYRAAYRSPDDRYEAFVNWDGATNFWADDSEQRLIPDLDDEIARLIALREDALAYFGWGEFGVADRRIADTNEAALISEGELVASRYRLRAWPETISVDQDGQGAFRCQIRDQRRHD